MADTKRYACTYDECEDGKKSAETMVGDILSDPEFPKLDGITIGSWGEAWEESCQDIIDGIIREKDKFSKITKLYIGDMDFEDCEVSWIIQGDYSKLWAAMPQLEELTIKGSQDLELGDMDLPNLKSFEIICGGLPENVIKSVKEAKLPKLEKLVLYIGVEDYGFDGSVDAIKELLEEMDFPNLKYLGIVDSDMQDELTEAVLGCRYMDSIETLDLSYGTLTDKGASLIAEKIGEFPNVKQIEIVFHYISDDGIKKLNEAAKKTGCMVHLDEAQEADEYDGEVYYYAMLTE